MPIENDNRIMFKNISLCKTVIHLHKFFLLCNFSARTIMQKAVKIAGLNLSDQKFNSEKEAIQVARDNTSVYFGGMY